MNKTLKSFLLLFFISTVAVVAQLEKNGFRFNVDNFPDIYGGKEEMKRFLHDHLIYPRKDLKNKKEGIVVLSFIVTKEGKPESIQVTTSVSAGIDKEAIRLIKLLDWIPAHQGDLPVSVNNRLEINFSIPKYKKQVKDRGFDTPPFTDLPLDSSLNVYETAERSPMFNMTEQTFSEFVYSKLEYPEVASRQNIEGNVKLSFVVEPDGLVADIRILNGGLAGGCNNEAIRVIGFTKWKPAIRDKQYVRYRMNFTMNFSLKNSFKDNANGSQQSWGR
jgi:TonB family protein